MRTTSFFQRVVSAATLLSFTATSLTPSLAWAVEREEPAPVVRDKVTSGELQHGRDAAELPSQREEPNGDPERVEDLQSAVGSALTAKPAAEVQLAAKDAAETAALPTGADKSGVTSQAISVPKGSGTIQGMGESFSAQLSTGIATFSVPFAMPAARGAAQPSLGLSYSSASGVGLAGVGWSVGVPFIARQTDRGLPGYDDRDQWHPNQDRFVFNGGEELVPICLVKSTTSCVDPNGADRLIPGEKMPVWASNHQYFRPRVEGSFLRFFWSSDHDTWRVQDKNGITMELGVPLDGSGSRDALEINPDDGKQTYRWHLVRQYDTYGDSNPASGNPKPLNVVVYRYFQEGGRAYLSDVYDTTPVAASVPPPITGDLSGYAHHTRLVYESRTDPTESYRTGWLIRETLRLQRVDVTSKTYLQTSQPRRLVRRYHLEYDSTFHTSYLQSVQVEGRCANDETKATPESNGVLGATICDGVTPAANRLPPMTFAYSHVSGFSTAGTAVESELQGYEAFDARLQQIGGDPPHSVDEAETDYFDINGDALPDVLVTAPGVYGSDFGVFFNSDGGSPRTFGTVTQLGVTGVLGANAGTIKLSNQNVAPLDFDGDGFVDFLHMPKVKTYSTYAPRMVGGKWKLVGKAIESASKQDPKIDLGKGASETRVADVNFDGLVDVVVSTGTEFQTFLSLGRLPAGYGQFGQGSWQSADRANLSNEPVRKCVPYSGSPVRFSDSDIQLADMNGDGIQDILRLRQGDFRYWPGRGNGYWGTGRLDDCPAGSFGDKRFIAMERAPHFSDIQGTTLRVDDVNGDGLDDLVQVRFDAVDVWLNVDGKSWTRRAIIDGTPASPSFANRVRLMDINGSGTRDIVWGNGKKYQFIDLAGGERPGLLVQVKNGLGKSTELEYRSSTDEMLAAARTGQKCAESGSAFGRAWCSKMPMVTHLVKRLTDSDNLSVAGSGIGRYVTEYEYADPVYDGRQREFRGFRHARSRNVGDANSPTDLTESTFLLGECEAAENSDDCAVYRDNVNEALKGLPIVQERYDETGRYLSTEATAYQLRPLYAGLDGRRVSHAFAAAKRTTLYDTAAPTTEAILEPFELVTKRDALPDAHTSTISGLTCGASVATSIASGGPFLVPRRSASGYAVTASSTVVDASGNLLVEVGHGCVEGACPGTGEQDSPTISSDELVCSFSQPKVLPKTGWLWRTEVSWSQGSVDTEKRGITTTAHTEDGASETSSVWASGMVPLSRGTSYAPRTPAPDPVTPAQLEPRAIVMSTRTFDAYGNVTREVGAENRCRDLNYDLVDGSGYRQLVTQEVIYTAGCPPTLPPTTGFLQTTAAYERGSALVTTVMDMSYNQSKVTYDQFGRLTSLTRPAPVTLPPNTVVLPSTKVEYDLPPVGSNRAYSIVHTSTQDGTSVSDSEYLESYSYMDGMGRPRVGLAEADPDVNQDGHEYVVSSIADFDAKGAVRRKYLPHFASDIDHSSFPIADELVDVPYGRQRYDAFGRQVQTLDVDGTVTLQSRYHALSTDLFDAADLYPGPHQGSYVSTRTDGHGRTIATTERVHANGVLERYEVRTKYLAPGHPHVITRLNLATQQRVTRWMVYDSLGRMVMNADPHATVGFTETPTTSSTLKTWRYVYNDAGDLVGTSDARGCGQNFVYDGAGRLKAEDYSPCEKPHKSYVPPNLSTGANYEVFYEYDDGASSVVTPPDAYDDASPNLKGRLKAVHDRASTTWFEYDQRGRTTKTRRKVSYIDAPQTTVAGRYVDHWYKREFAYDAADRPIEETTGVGENSVLRSKNASKPSSVFSSYTKRGTLRAVDSSYGPLLSNIKRSADGLVREMTFGDEDVGVPEITSAKRYDSRRRLSSVQTFRQVANLWSTAPPAISPAVGEADDPTRQILLQDLDYSYDVVGNPTEIRDWRIPEEWPDGAKPATRRMEYDDLNRVTRVDYEYPNGFDKFVSPFAAEIGGESEPRRALPRGHRLISNRPLWQSYKYDWLGNTTSTDDDQHAYYDRSLGTITNNSAQGKPYQFMLAAQQPTGGLYNGSTFGTTYDAAGNLTFLRIANATATCTTQISACYSRIFYEWDEVGRLSQARRVEGEGPNSSGPWVDMLYDANDQRVLKQSRQSAPVNGQIVSGPSVTTVYVFDSLELRRAQFNPTTLQYPIDATTEVAYLVANGGRVARLHYEPPGVGEPQLVQESSYADSKLHVLLSVPDHLGSTSVVVDLATSELVEARTYQPQGATETDYRPNRWQGFREDYGFTGKEEDVELGLLYYGKRYLSPYLGRWISADPLAVHAPGAGDLNLYAYVRGSLLKAIDPVGLDGEIPVNFVPDNVRAEAKQAGVEIKEDGTFAFQNKQTKDVLVYAPKNPQAMSRAQYAQFLNIMAAGAQKLQESLDPNAIEGGPGETVLGDVVSIVGLLNMDGAPILDGGGDAGGLPGATGDGSLKGEEVQLAYVAAAVIAVGAWAGKVASGAYKGSARATSAILSAAEKKYDKLYSEATKARELLVEHLQDIGTAGEHPTVVGGFNFETGEVVAGAKAQGAAGCSEDVVREGLGDFTASNPDIGFTTAARPRNNSRIHVCENCVPRHGPASFPDHAKKQGGPARGKPRY